MSSILIRNGRLWTGGTDLEDKDLRVVDGRIAEIGESLQPAEAEVRLDAEGLAILPGLINAHVHFCLDGSADSVGQLARQPLLTTAYKAAQLAERTLWSGTTTVRDVGCTGAIGIRLKQAIDAGLVRGPRMLASGACITMTGGHNRFIGVEVDGMDAARKAARQQLKLGADLIKVVATGGVITAGVEPEHPQLGAEEMRAAVEEAHNVGKHAAAHAQGRSGIANALTAGVDTIEHGIYLTPDLIDTMLARGTVLVPTLTPMRRILDRGEGGEIPAFAVQKMARVRDIWLDSFRAAMAAGIPIVAGTDAGTPLNPHGSVAVELAFMVEAGMPPLDALHSATDVAARAIGLGEQVGAIRKGLMADLILVAGDPLTDVHSLVAGLRGVIRGGETLWLNTPFSAVVPSGE